MDDKPDLLTKIEKRPEMYIGSRSIGHLRTFLDGYFLGSTREESGALSDELGEFREWVAAKHRITTNHSWNQIILFYSTNESDALDRFFSLLREFRNAGSPTGNNAG